MWRLFLSWLLIVPTSGAFAQATELQVEVASLRPHEGEVPRTGGRLSVAGPRLTVVFYSVSGLIMFAYDVKLNQISATAPMDNTPYDIVATAGDGRTPTRDEFRLMMRALLAERFELKVHRETKVVPVYALVVRKGGPKFKESTADGNPSPKFEVSGHNVTTILPKVTMESLAERIQNNARLDRPVLDRTGLVGSYEIKLTFNPKYISGLEPDPNEISVFTGVQELGLRLVSQTASRDFLVIDHIEKASAN